MFDIESLHGFLKGSEEPWVVSVDVSARCLFGVDELAVIGFRLGTGIDSDFEATSNSLVHVQVVDELTSAEDFLDFFDKSNGVLAVASAATELELDHVRCVFVAQDLTGSRCGARGSPLGRCLGKCC